MSGNGIRFDESRWAEVIGNYGKWWGGELGRPLIHLTIENGKPGRPEPESPSHSFTSFYDSQVSAEEIIDRWDYDLSCQEFLGDSFPSVVPNFGPGVMAAFLGASLENGNETVWFRPESESDLRELHFRYDPGNYWLNRIKDICAAAARRWSGRVQVAMTDLGGNLDIVSTFRPSEKLLLDLYDNPDEVKRLTWEAHELWWRYFEEINDVIRPSNPGYSAWPGILSTDPHYMLQCDFSYMIGPEMFDEFVKPELVASCRRLPNSFYHLDGPGQLRHLDSLLAIPELKGIQWIPGAGAPDFTQWPEVYRKIRDAGKLIQVFGGVEELDALASQLGDASAIILIGQASDREQAIDCLRRYGAI